MTVRLKDIAEKAGVSISTVSRVINNDKSKPASKKTTEKIWKIVNEMGYVPNQEARHLIKGETGDNGKSKTRTIGCIYTSTNDSHHDPFFSQIGVGIQSELDKLGYVLSFAISTRGMNFSTFFNFLTVQNVDGIIVMGRFRQEILDYLKSNYINLVYAGVNFVDAGFDEVICDGYNGASAAVEYLIRCGHKSIGFMGDSTSNEETKVVNEHRFEGYLDTIKKHNLKINNNHIIYTEPYTPIAYETMKKYLDSTSKESMPTALFCANDATAIGAMKALNEHKFSIPEDIAIVGFDDVEISSYMNPSLTTISVPKEELGKMAVRVLTDRIENSREYPVRMDIPFELKIRDSG